MAIKFWIKCSRSAVDFQLPNLFLAALADALLSSYKLWEKVSLEKRPSYWASPELKLQTFQPVSKQ